MPSAIALRPSGGDAAWLRALWALAEGIEDSPSMASLGYAPHVTLAVYEEIEEARLRAAVGRAGTTASAIPLTFRAIRHFDGPPMVLWAAPEPSTALDDLHRALHAEIDPVLCRPHFRPGAFVPHSSIATAVRADRRDRALAIAARPIDAFTVLFDRLDVLTFSPVVIRETRCLPETA